MDWVIGIVGGLVSAAAWSAIAWWFLRAQRATTQDIGKHLNDRLWQIRWADDMSHVFLTYKGRGTADAVGLCIDRTGSPQYLLGDNVRRNRSQDVKVGTAIGMEATFAVILYQARPHVVGRNKFIKWLWLDKVEHRQDFQNAGKPA